MDELDPLQNAIKAGVDIDLLERNLSLTPEQRAKEHQKALDLVLELDKIRKRRDENAH